MVFTSAISYRRLQEVFFYDSMLKSESIERVIGDSHNTIIKFEIVVAFIYNYLLLHPFKEDVMVFTDFFIYPIHQVSLREEMDSYHVPDPLLWVEEADTQPNDIGCREDYLGKRYQEFLLYTQVIHVFFLHGGPDPSKLPPLDLTNAHSPIDSANDHLNEFWDNVMDAFLLLL
ncbi:hypothetical protein KI387_012759, partial [Taxus chinensis]